MFVWDLMQLIELTMQSRLYRQGGPGLSIMACAQDFEFTWR
jgi:hypothetical protein